MKKINIKKLLKIQAFLVGALHEKYFFEKYIKNLMPCNALCNVSDVKFFIANETRGKTL